MKTKIVILSMIKNELDVLNLWIHHHSKIADQFYIIDHMSSDGTHEALQNLRINGFNIKIFSYTNPGYFQKEVLTKVAKTIYEEQGDCWIIPLDADEFLTLDTYNHFKEFCNSLTANSQVKLSWRNASPLILEKKSRVSPYDLIIESNIDDPTYGKLMFHSSITTNDGFVVHQGAHGINVSGKSITISNKQWPILHLPIRSELQFTLKLFQGVNAYIETNNKDSTKAKLGFHWFKMAEEILLDRNATFDIMRSYIFHYGKSNVQTPKLSIGQLKARGWNLNSPFTMTPVFSSSKINYSETIKFINTTISNNTNEHIRVLGKRLLTLIES